MPLHKIKNTIYTGLNVKTPYVRRENLLLEMDSLGKKDVHCYNCTGTCCTMSANSMQVTPLEAFEIILSLDVTLETINEIKEKLRHIIHQYRLDHEIFLGKKGQTHLRKTYTCPFFIPGAKGCTIKKELKPYGCLGFNPRMENDNGNQCHSDFNLLQKREEPELESEDLANNYLRKEFNLNWHKLEIPKAVMALLEKIFI